MGEIKESIRARQEAECLEQNTRMALSALDGVEIGQAFVAGMLRDWVEGVAKMKCVVLQGLQLTRLEDGTYRRTVDPCGVCLPCVAREIVKLEALAACEDGFKAVQFARIVFKQGARSIPGNTEWLSAGGSEDALSAADYLVSVGALEEHPEFDFWFRWVKSQQPTCASTKEEG